MKRINAKATAVASVLTALAGIGLGGLQVRPQRHTPLAGEKRDFGRIRVPDNLPAPVERYFKTIAGDELPITHTALVWGRPFIRKGALKLPLRFTSYINAGRDYRREIDVTWFGLPLLRVIDSYVDGVAASQIGRNAPIQSSELDQAACLNLWAEAMWTPSAFLTDPRIHWETIDADTVWLYVPFNGSEERLLVSFDPHTGLINCVSGDRYKATGQPRVHWSCEPSAWLPYGGVSIPSKVAIRWEDEKRPWTEWEIDGILFNEDVSHKLPTLPYPATDTKSLQKDDRSRMMPNVSRRMGKRTDDKKHHVISRKA